MSSSRDQIVRAEEEERDSLECSEDSLRQKTTVTAIGKVSQISIHARYKRSLKCMEARHVYMGFVT
jgi:hypothetical protein